MRGAKWLWLGLWVCTLTFGCSRVWRGQLADPGAFDQPAEEDAPFLKVHLTDGSVYVLEDFIVSRDEVEGTGLLYDPERNQVGTPAKHVVPRERIALLETSRPERVAHPEYAVMGVLTVGTAVGATLCAMSPKTCFGSCPTFYLPGADRPVAEGFSKAMAPALELRDVDAVGVFDGSVRMIVRNEALETHHIRTLEAWHAPIPTGWDRLRRTPDNRTFAVRKATPPSTCTGLGPRCVEALAAADGKDAFLHASATDLGERVDAHVEFDTAFETSSGRLGVVVTARRSLIDTFVFYQMLAFAGHHAGHYVARLGWDPVWLLTALRMEKALGALEISRWRRGRWEAVGEFREVGPIATDAWLFVLDAPMSEDSLKLRLRMARGLFRIESVELVEVGPEARLDRVGPQVLTSNVDSVRKTHRYLADPGMHLVTQPKDRFEIRFDLGPGPREVFVASTGFYTEWMRPSWLREQDEAKFLRYTRNPALALKELASKYKELEPVMEAQFWESRFGHRDIP